MEKIMLSSVVLSASVLIYWFLCSERWRNKFLFVASVCFMASFSLKYTIYFVLNAGLVYYAGIRMRTEDNNRKIYIKLILVWLIGSLCFFKYIHLLVAAIYKLGFQLPEMPETIFTKIAIPLGMSYIIFRMIHYVIEMYKKKLPDHSFWEFALYLFFFPTFIAGPVDRFQNFQPQTKEEKRFNPTDINAGLLRIISGMIKKFIVADSLTPLIMPLLSSPDEHSRFLVILSMYVLAIQIYMDFSGYTDMALGVSRLFGYKIIENFNYPYFKKNIVEFWRSWHISIYTLIRDYFFLPIFSYRPTELKIYIGLFLTMMVFCLWHGGEMHYLILGVYHGSGLVIFQFFQDMKRKHRRLRKIVDHPYSNPLSILLTFSFVSFGMVIFAFDISSVNAILQKIFI